MRPDTLSQDKHTLSPETRRALPDLASGLLQWGRSGMLDASASAAFAGTGRQESLSLLDALQSLRFPLHAGRDDSSDPALGGYSTSGEQTVGCLAGAVSCPPSVVHLV